MPSGGEKSHGAGEAFRQGISLPPAGGVKTVDRTVELL